ncbi:MCP four helix bundle domain-containing protein [Clostridium sp.]|uniref:MCP four helix bundle domain-containing protein n=1 Tax=Clostridium sp. TaxID=1506 RepID=UPI0028507B2E|nr:MCP four helix bundle domain-containing protein [Clostridium sp.]MDR3598446.1 MCP four helix bundle domain-containing protein [Clostridium sp.]
MRVKIKLILSFIIVAILICVVGAIGIMPLKTVNANSKDMYSTSLQNVYMLTDMKENFIF